MRRMVDLDTLSFQMVCSLTIDEIVKSQHFDATSTIWTHLPNMASQVLQVV